MSEADLQRSIAHYNELATRYDRRTRWIDAIRLRTIAALELRPGDTVLDAGCGTGWCIPELARRIGPSGRVIGFDPAPEMLAIARRRTVPAGTPVDLMLTDAKGFGGAASVDAILFSYTHDLLQSSAALDRVLSAARPGARVAATGKKLYARWLFPANWYLRASHRGYITDFEGFKAPWGLLAERLEDFRVETGPFTQHYIARGRTQAAWKTK